MVARRDGAKRSRLSAPKERHYTSSDCVIHIGMVQFSLVTMSCVIARFQGVTQSSRVLATVNPTGRQFQNAPQASPKWRNGRRGSLKNCWEVTPVSVRVRPSAPRSVPGCVAVARRTLDPLALVRIQARQPKPTHGVTQGTQTGNAFRLHNGTA
jgi:hypothetical protein